MDDFIGDLQSPHYGSVGERDLARWTEQVLIVLAQVVDERGLKVRLSYEQQREVLFAAIEATVSGPDHSLAAFQRWARSDGDQF